MRKLLAIPTALCLTAVGAHAATLTLGARTQVSGINGNYNLSVVDGNAKYDDMGKGGDGTTTVTFTTTLADGTLTDYNLIHSPSESISTYASKGTRITMGASAPGNINGAGENWANVWTTSDPGADMTAPTNAKDFTNGSVSNTFARTANISGSIDITGLPLGLIYIPHGTYNNGWSLTLTMTGTGQPDIVSSDSVANGVIGNNNVGWINNYTFTNEGQYDTIAFQYINNDTDGSRARFQGVMLGVPEPSSTTALFSLSALGLILRRRR